MSGGHRRDGRDHSSTDQPSGFTAEGGGSGGADGGGWRTPTPRIAPSELIERIDPAHPTERIDPADPMQRIDPAEPNERIEPTEPTDRIDKAEPNDRADARLTTLSIDQVDKREPRPVVTLEP